MLPRSYSTNSTTSPKFLSGGQVLLRVLRGFVSISYPLVK
jgi:hypothetical protein